MKTELTLYCMECGYNLGSFIYKPDPPKPGVIFIMCQRCADDHIDMFGRDDELKGKIKIRTQVPPDEAEK